MFGLSILPIMGLLGATVDYARASAVRNELQAAADATSLALAKDMVTATTSEINLRANAAFKANFTGRFGSTIQSLNVTKLSDRFKVDATALVNYTIMPVLGPSSGIVGATSTSGWAINKIEIALVLDNTGSMGSANKMLELKKALCGNPACSDTNPKAGFVATMKKAAIDTDQIRISLVPFDTTVRVPLNIQNAVASGAPQAGAFTYGGQGYCSGNPTSARRVSWTLAGVPSISWFRFADRDKNTTDYDPITGAWIGKACDMAFRPTQANWLGCIWDRDQDMNRDTGPVGVSTAIETLYPAVACRSNKLARMAPLVDVRTSTPALINSLATMQPSGNTNLTIGVNWGTNMLMQGLPMSTAVAPTANLDKFMILLTDGTNTENRQTGNAAAIDARARLACASAKAQKIKIYAIRVIDGNKSLLEECASGPGFYFDVSDATKIDAVFKEIASRIGAIRLTS